MSNFLFADDRDGFFSKFRQQLKLGKFRKIR